MTCDDALVNWKKFLLILKSHPRHEPRWETGLAKAENAREEGLTIILQPTGIMSDFRFLLSVLFFFQYAAAAVLSPGMSPLLGGSLSWYINPNFGSGNLASGVRTVTFRLYTAFEMSSSCSYDVVPIQCCAGTPAKPTCMNANNSALVHGVLCVVPLKKRLVGDKTAFGVWQVRLAMFLCC